MSLAGQATKVFSRPDLMRLPFPYCPGCGHGVAHRLLAEVLEELGITRKTILVTSVGCSVRMWQHFRCDVVQAPHGRGAAVATGLRRALPSDCVIIPYQGDGDLLAIGAAETIHSAARAENITILFINNACFGATGGQIAPTTLLGQITTSSPLGRDASLAGYPIRVCELLSGFEGVYYLARVGIYDAASVTRTREVIKKAIESQMEGKGFSLVEVLSPCPTNLRLNPPEAAKWVKEKLAAYFPLGEIKGGNST